LEKLKDFFTHNLLFLRKYFSINKFFESENIFPKKLFFHEKKMKNNFFLYCTQMHQLNISH